MTNIDRIAAALVAQIHTDVMQSLDDCPDGMPAASVHDGERFHALVFTVIRAALEREDSATFHLSQIVKELTAERDALKARVAELEQILGWESPGGVLLLSRRVAELEAQIADAKREGE